MKLYQNQNTFYTLKSDQKFLPTLNLSSTLPLFFKGHLNSRTRFPNETYVSLITFLN